MMSDLIRVKRTTHETIKKMAEEEGMTIGEVVALALKDYEEKKSRDKDK